MKPNIILKIYLLLSLLLFADITAYFTTGISLRGYYADIILFWFCFFGSIVMIIVYWKMVLAKIALFSMLLSVVLSMLPMGLPFYAFVLVITPFGLWKEKDLTPEYRAQIVSYSVMVPPWLEIIEKNGIIEQKMLRCYDSDLLDAEEQVRIRNAKDIIFETETDTTISFTLFYGGPNKTLVFDKRTRSMLNDSIILKFNSLKQEGDSKGKEE